MRWILVLAACVVAGWVRGVVGAEPATQGTVVSRAVDVALVEVVKVRREDVRPADGDLTEVIGCKVVEKSKGVGNEVTITVKVAEGGNSPMPRPVFKPSGPVMPGSMVEGRRYWLVYGAGRVVLGMWEDDENAPREELRERMKKLNE